MDSRCRFQGLGATLLGHYRRLDDSSFEDIFQLGIAEMKKRLEILKIQLEKCEANRSEFNKLYKKIHSASSATATPLSPPTTSGTLHSHLPPPPNVFSPSFHGLSQGDETSLFSQ